MAKSWQSVPRAAFAVLLMLFGVAGWSATSTLQPSIHLGVASCSGSTCHSRQQPNGALVRQNEIITWQDPSSVSGAHSRAWRVLLLPRAQAISARMGIGPAQSAPQCLGCHVGLVPDRKPGPGFQISDGVGCEACHGGAERYIASHAAVGATPASNALAGMIRLDVAQTRAGLCLDCHFGSNRPGQFANHQIMAAGHPRLRFELDLFTSLQRHHDEDADYLARKGTINGAKIWAIGQSLALSRQLALFADPLRGMAGSFPEFTAFDCRSCHRTISDDPATRTAAARNATRPVSAGAVIFNDENMILLAAAARVIAPPQAAAFSSAARQFHASIGSDRTAALRDAAALRNAALQLANRFEVAPFSPAQSRAILHDILRGPAAEALSDYQGGAQAVMAVDTLLSALVNSKSVDPAQAQALRPAIDRAFAATRDANHWQPSELRAAFAAMERGL